jgi:hypothetical protein
MNSTNTDQTVGPKPIITPPTEICLRGACGPGFGRGQMLARMHLRERGAKLVVERAFLPSTISSDYTTHPFAWQTRPFKPEVSDFKNWTYVILEIAVDSVTPAVFQIDNLDGSPIHSQWFTLDLGRLMLDEETGCRLAILTGLLYRKQKLKPRRGSYLRNFQDADTIDMLEWRPKPRARPDPDDCDPSFQSPTRQARQAKQVIPPASTNTKVTLDTGKDKLGVIAFLAKNFQGEQCSVLVKPSVEAEAKAPTTKVTLNPDARSRQQPKIGDRPNRLPPRPLQNGLASGLRGFTLK